MSNGKSWPSEHPWMTFFLGLAGLSAIITIVRGYQPPPQRLTATVPLPKGFEASGFLDRFRRADSSKAVG